jgi:ABC-type glycerol-3-phosphate transport system permease component
MKTLTALFWGVATGAAAVFLHLFLPPFGIVLAVLGTFTSIWAVGRRYGKRRYKVLATGAWIYIFAQAASFGNGKEIFIQGDSLGNYFLASSFIALCVALLLPAK